MSRFTIYFTMALAACSVVAFSTAANLHQFINTFGVVLFSILLLAITGTAIKENINKNKSEPA